MHLLVDEKEGSVTTPVYLLPYSDPVKVLGLVQCMNIVISLGSLWLGNNSWPQWANRLKGSWGHSEFVYGIKYKRNYLVWILLFCLPNQSYSTLKQHHHQIDIKLSFHPIQIFNPTPKSFHNLETLCAYYFP